MRRASQLPSSSRGYSLGGRLDAHPERRGVELCEVPVQHRLGRVDRIEHRQRGIDLQLSLDPLHLW